MFKSWLVANIEVVLILFTVLFLIAVGAFSIMRFNSTNEDAYLTMLVFGGIAAVILCIVLVSLIKSGLGSFFTLLVVGGFIAFCAISSNETGEYTSSAEKPETEDSKVQQDATHENDEVSLMLDKAVERFNWSWLIIAAIPAFFFALFSSIYAYRNFDDVVSRRFLFRNSNVSVFEVQWKYTFNRFYAGFMTVFAIGLELMIFIALKP